jgi:hypothetical protein
MPLIWDRYKSPLIILKTSSMNDGREEMAERGQRIVQMLL